MWSWMILLMAMSASADKLAFIGDSQSAASYGLFAQLKKPIEQNGHHWQNGRSISGATVDGYITGRIPGARFPGVYYLLIQNEVISYPTGNGETIAVSHLLAEVDTVIVQLGDNHLDNPMSIKNSAQNLVRQISAQGKKCIWVGPAAVHPNCTLRRLQKEKVNQILSDALSTESCHFINSFELTKNSPPPTSDCVHYTNYDIWEKAIESSILTSLKSTIP